MAEVEVETVKAGPSPILDRPLGDLEVVASLTEMQSRGKIPLSRFIHGSAEINGKIFVCGGRDKESNSLADTYLYDPVTSTCHELADLPSARCGHTLMAYDDKLICFGGYDGEKFFNDVLSYDPKDNKWTTESSGTGSPPNRYCHCAAIVDDKMYILGGDNHKDKLCDLWSLDLGTMKWTEVKVKGKNAPESRQGSCASSHGGKLYTFGGFDKTKHVATNDMWSFDPATNEWTEIDAKGTVPNGRHGHAGVVFGDSWIIHGGRKDHGEKYNIDVYDYQFDVDEWRRLGVVQHAASPWGCPAVRFGHQAVLEPYTNAIIITGGYTHTDGVTFCPTNTTMRLDLLPTLHSVTAITSRIAPLESKTEQLVEIAEDLKGDVAAVQEKMKELEDDTVTIKEKQDQLDEKIQPVVEAVPKLEEAAKVADDKILELEDATKEAGDKLAACEEKEANLEERVAKLEDDVNQLQDLAGVSKDQDDMKKEMADFRERALPGLEDGLNDAAKKAEEYQAKLDELQAKLDELEEKEQELDAKEQKLEDKEKELSDKLDELQKELNDLKADSEAVKDGVGDMDDLRDKLAQLEAENKDLRENVSKLVDLSDLYQRVESLRQAMEGTINETKKVRELGDLMAGFGTDIPTLDFPAYGVYSPDDTPEPPKEEEEPAPPAKKDTSRTKAKR